ncbi:hypothetical protein TL16_g06060 [Triparma laevis f. inornata]|uniref:Uncharacterized protein n=1 Tax=Triparma laevis f. inornata TaxID=1714386 RepID=A0A9W7AIP2_9STRA|nr:hypothetical protein TL16_g06060 [Triparma laevis f. inornata]
MELPPPPATQAPSSTFSPLLLPPTVTTTLRQPTLLLLHILSHLTHRIFPSSLNKIRENERGLLRSWVLESDGLNVRSVGFEMWKIGGRDVVLEKYFIDLSPTSLPTNYSDLHTEIESYISVLPPLPPNTYLKLTLSPHPPHHPLPNPLTPFLTTLPPTFPLTTSETFLPSPSLLFIYTGSIQKLCTLKSTCFKKTSTGTKKKYYVIELLGSKILKYVSYSKKEIDPEYSLSSFSKVYKFIQEYHSYFFSLHSPRMIEEFISEVKINCKVNGGVVRQALLKISNIQFSQRSNTSEISSYTSECNEEDDAAFNDVQKKPETKRRGKERTFIRSTRVIQVGFKGGC